MNPTALILTLFLLLSPASFDSYIVDRVIDGDTVEIINNDGLKKVRMACIDAPENSQPQGFESKATLEQLLPSGDRITLNEVGVDRYGRTVGIIYNGDRDTNKTMIERGEAVVYRQYLYNCPDAKNYLKAEKTARNEETGVWGDPLFVEPRVYRSRLRQVKKEDKVKFKGSCKELRRMGYYEFDSSSPNYSLNRDRDRDNVACE